MTLIEINEELKSIRQREQELLEMKSKIRLTKEEKSDIEYNQLINIANTINEFYFANEKDRKKIFNNNLIYIGMYSRYKWLDMKHITELLDKIENILGKQIDQNAKKLFLKVYSIIEKNGMDSIYDSEKIAKIKIEKGN